MLFEMSNTIIVVDNTLLKLQPFLSRRLYCRRLLSSPQVICFRHTYEIIADD